MRTNTLLLFFTAIAIGLIAVSCGGNNDLNVKGDDDRVYPVTFSVSSFKIEETPVKAKKRGLSEDDISTFLQYVVYNEDGTEYSSRIEDIAAKDIRDHKIVLNLPEGKFKVAFLRGKFLDPFIYGICPIDFYTDFCAGNVDFNPGGRKPNNNNELYYEWLDINVVPTVIINESIELQPMWSTLSLKVKDLATCKFPATAAKASLAIDNYTYGFYVNSKKAKNEGFMGGSGKGAYTWPKVSLVDFKAGNTFKSLLIAENNATSLILSFYDDKDVFLGAVKLFEGKLSKGKNISLTGSLGDLSHLDPEEEIYPQTFSLYLGALEDEEIPFLD